MSWKTWDINLPSDKFLRGQVSATLDYLVVGGFQGEVHLLPLHANKSTWTTFTRPGGDIRALTCHSSVCFTLIYDKTTQQTLIESLDLCNPESGWCEVAVLPDELQVRDVAITVSRQYIYALGGRKWSASKHAVATARVFDVTTGKWDKLPDMKEERSSSSVAIVNHTLFVGGGRYNDGSYSNKVEALDLDESYGKSGEWRTVTPTERYDPTLVQFNGKLLALGGAETCTWLSPTSSTQLLDETVHPVWLSLPNLTHHWMSHGAVSCGNLLIVAGGLTPARYLIESTKLMLT